MRKYLFTLALLPACFAQSPSVALTFDDLPLGGGGTFAEAVRANDGILASLARHHVPAAAFVVERGIQNIGETGGWQILRKWVTQGHDLANHTFSHRNFDDLTVEEFQQEIVLGEPSIRTVMTEAGRPVRYFRFPMNHTGDTREKHDAIAAFLHARGYTLAVCTLENADYEFARVYRLLLERKDDAAAKRLKSDYLAYSAAEIDYYANLQRNALGREIPHVMLLHANQLNADTMDGLLAIFRQRQYRFVKLEQALSDEVYARPDTVITKFGPMWAYRWAQQSGVKLDTKGEPEIPAWILQFGKQGGAKRKPRFHKPASKP